MDQHIRLSQMLAQSQHIKSWPHLLCDTVS